MTREFQTIPVSVIGGFLGAGKTTLINRLLSAEDTPRCTLLVNDFGDIAVDAALIKSRNGNILSLKNGCVCCSMGSDLGLALSQALGIAPKPDRIIVEASGVAHPGRIMDVARITRELSPGGIYVLVDADGIHNQLADRWISDTVLQQLVSADYLVLSKTQNLEPGRQMEAIDELFTHCPQKRIFKSEDITWSEINHVVSDQKPILDKHFHPQFLTRTLRSSLPLDLPGLQHWVTTTPGVYRMKGWFVDHKNKVKLLQVVDQRVNVLDSNEIIDGKFLAIVIGNNNLPKKQTILNAITVSR